MNDTLSAKDIFKFVGLVLVIIVATTLILGYFEVISLPLMNIRTKVTRASNQYVTSKQQELVDSLAQWETIEAEKAKVDDEQVIAGYDAQQAGIVRRMKHLRPTSVRPWCFLGMIRKCAG